jgi:hypothetical protein
MDPDPDSDPDPATFVIDLSRRQQKPNLKKKFFCLLLFEGTKNSKNQGFSYHFSLKKEGSGSVRYL